MAGTLTSEEQRVVIMHRAVTFLTELTFGLNSACMNLKLIDMAAGDMGKIATAHAWHWCFNAGLKIFTTPLFASLSDSFGRIPFWAVGRFSYFTYFLGLHLCRTLNQFSFVMVFGQCIMPAAASLTVQAAAWSDAFGSRPALSSNLQATTQVWTSAAGLIGPVIGGFLATKSRTAGFFICMGLCAFQTLVVLTIKETLPPERRKPFRITSANPVTGLSILLRNGPGLRRLALAAACFESTSHVYATMDTYRMGPIKLTPSVQSYYSALLSGANMVTTQFVARPMLAQLGPRKSFETGSLIATAAYVLLSQACRPVGSPGWRLAVQYVLAKCLLMTPWSVRFQLRLHHRMQAFDKRQVRRESCIDATACPMLFQWCCLNRRVQEPARFATSAMIVKQGLAVTSAGRGEINAAVESLTSITQLFMPAVWVWLFRMAIEAPPDSFVARIVGPGGHFLVAAAVRLLGRAIVRSIDPAHLSIEDEENGAEKHHSSMTSDKGK